MSKIRIRSMSDDQFIAHLQRKGAAERHALLLCDLRSHFEAANRGKCSWSFERDYLKLKSYMALHHWSAGDVAEKFGVSYKDMTKLYFRLQKSC